MAGESKKSVIAALIGNALIAATKFTAALFTGSSAMLAEAIHSTSDTGNQVLLLFGLRQSKKPADRMHPFGHGKEIYFWSLIVAVSLFGIGGGISIYEGILAVSNPHPVENAIWNYIVLGLAFLFETGSLTIAAREFWKYKGDRGALEAIHQGKDPTFFVVLFEDTAAIIGVVVAAAGIYLAGALDQPAFDAGASIVIGAILCGVALWLAWESKGLLVGESADEGMVRRVDAIATEDPAVEHATKILTMHVGPDDILVTMDLQFFENLTAEDLHDSVERIEKRVREEYPAVTNMFIEIESFARRRGDRTGGPEEKKAQADQDTGPLNPQSGAAE